MQEPKALKQPQRAAADVQASALAQVRFTAPAETDEEQEAVVVTPTRFQIDGALRSITLVDDSSEYCIEVMDEESERVWEIAVWASPPGSDIALSHCLVVGSKNEAREVLRILTGAPAFVSKASQAARGQQQRGYGGGGVTQKPGRTQQKQG